jgi:hypothetical protein
MENTVKQVEILTYLNKNYVVVDNNYLDRAGIHEWGGEIINSLIKIFYHSRELTESTFKFWAFANGVDDDNWEESLWPKRLKANWTPEMADDLRQYGIINVEEQLINILSQEIAKEIDAEILSDLKGQFKSSNDFLNVVKCMGYEPGPTIYDPITFTPTRPFVKLKYNEIENERKNNTYWQDWFKNRSS